jgi:hypothetical protein
LRNGWERKSTRLLVGGHGVPGASKHGGSLGQLAISALEEGERTPGPPDGGTSIPRGKPRGSGILSLDRTRLWNRCDYGTADVHSLRAESFALIDYFADFLGQPLREPHPVNIGELMDSEDEIPVNGFWHIRADQRDAIVAELLQAVERQEMRDG